MVPPQDDLDRRPRSFIDAVRAYDAKNRPPAEIPVEVAARVNGDARGYVNAALHSELAAVAAANPGTINDILNLAAFNLGQFVGAGHLDYQEVAEALYQSALTAYAGNIDGEGVPATIRSGLDAGVLQPRQIPERPVQPDPAVTVIEGEHPVLGHRALKLTAASSIKVRQVKWLWDKRVPLGTLVLLAGREGIGKSTVAYTLAGQITRGDLPGAYTGQPRGVIVAATEDSWEHTIVPRLMAAGADLDRVHRVDVATSEGVDTGLSLPRDLRALEEAALSVDCALILLDPLMSRLDGKLDTHRDAEVRTALEPLVAVAERARATVLGLIHVNKSVSTDALTTIMGSRAFAAVARAVLFVMTDPDDDAVRLLGQPKNNLGSVDLPTLTFRIESAHVADTEEGPVWTGRVNWLGESNRSISEALESASDSIEGRSATAEAADWLLDHLTSHGGTDDSASIKAEGGRAGHSLSTLKRARHRLRATSEASGFPRRTYWTLPGTAVQLDQHSGSSPGESGPTEPTGLTGPTHAQSVLLDQSDQPPARDEPTGNCTDCHWPIGSIGCSCSTNLGLERSVS